MRVRRAGGQAGGRQGRMVCIVLGDWVVGVPAPCGLRRIHPPGHCSPVKATAGLCCRSFHKHSMHSCEHPVLPRKGALEGGTAEGGHSRIDQQLLGHAAADDAGAAGAAHAVRGDEAKGELHHGDLGRGSIGRQCSGGSAGCGLVDWGAAAGVTIRKAAAAAEAAAASASPLPGGQHGGLITCNCCPGCAVAPSAPAVAGGREPPPHVMYNQRLGRHHRPSPAPRRLLQLGGRRARPRCPPPG